MQKIDKLALCFVAVFLVLFGYMSHLDYEAEQAAAEHAKECQQAAQQAAMIRKTEYNRLAKRGHDLTGFEGREQ